MLPEKLSTDLTSLNEGEDRAGAGHRDDGARRRHRRATAASIARSSTTRPSSPTTASRRGSTARTTSRRRCARVEGLAETLRLQDRTADRMRDLRHEHGALDLETIEARPVIRDGQVVDLQQAKRNNARLLIEDFMIAANGATARFLAEARIRRASAASCARRSAGTASSGSPRSWASGCRPSRMRARWRSSCSRRRKADPMRFPDLSLSIVKAMGAGEYVVEEPGDKPIGHFGLAVKDYTHSTAPNRRYPDLITHRLVKAALAGKPQPYDIDELAELAEHCTDAGRRGEQGRAPGAQGGRGVHARATASASASTASSPAPRRKGRGCASSVRRSKGKLVRGWEGLDIGDRVKVKLIDVDVERGFIDFVRS